MINITQQSLLELNFRDMLRFRLPFLFWYNNMPSVEVAMLVRYRSTNSLTQPRALTSKYAQGNIHSTKPNQTSGFCFCCCTFIINLIRALGIRNDSNSCCAPPNIIFLFLFHHCGIGSHGAVGINIVAHKLVGLMVPSTLH